jgi:hypothetical protein
MKILFMMTEPRVMKYYHETLRFMLKNGHSVHVAYFSLEKYRKGTLHEELATEFPERFSYEVVSGKRAGIWRDLCIAISWAEDYLFFLRPFFSSAARLRERVEIRISPVFVWLMNRCPGLSTPAGREAMAARLRVIDRAVPASRSHKRYIRKIRPDALLVSPLLSHSGQQSEYLRAARSLGVPTAYCVASWDNLTTKGAMRGDPDYIILWNDIQKKEAIDLHGAAAERILVTGAQYFDEWFVRRPSRDRKDFCRIVGLPSDRPILMYMCSSNFMAPNERVFVLKWIASLRRSAAPEIAEAGVLIRPYPEYADQWREVDFSPYGNVVVWPSTGEYAITESAKRNFYDSVYHSLAVVGVNTTAMIESAIIGRCVLSVLASEFNESQSNTIHFSYLKQENGGFLYLARDLDEHIAHLEIILREEDRMSQQIARFVAHFARPHGIHQPCVPIVAQAIEELRETAPGKRSTSIQTLMLRYALYPVAVAFKVGRLLTRLKKKRDKQERKRLFQAAAAHGADPLVYIRSKKGDIPHVD